MAQARSDQPHAPDGSPLAGIALMCAGVLCLTITDVFAKWLGTLYPVPLLTFIRMLVALPLILAVGLLLGGAAALKTRRPLAHLGRGLLATCATFSFFLSLTLLPLAEATAIAFTAPLFVTVLAIPLLGERPKRAQWVVTVVGFLGVLMIVRPGTAAFTPAALVPLITAVAYGLMMLTARMLGRRESIWATMLYSTLVPLIVSATTLPWFWTTPALVHVPLFIAVGFFGALALTLITQAFRVGIASVVAPFDYTGLLWATVFGWLLWNELPGRLALLGGVVIAVCGVYLAYSQTNTARLRSAGAPLAPPRSD